MRSSRGLYSFKQWKNIKEIQRSTEIHGSTSASSSQSSIRMSSMEAWAGPTPLPRRCISVEQHILDGPISRQMLFGFYSSGSFTAHLKKVSGFFLYCLKLRVFGTTSQLKNHSQWEACKKWPLFLPHTNSIQSAFLGRGKHLRNTFPSLTTKPLACLPDLYLQTSMQNISSLILI